jgi:hypothetical protein
MTADIYRLPLLCLALLFSATPSSTRQERSVAKFAGTYVVGHEFGGGSFTLAADGRYSAVSGSDDGTSISQSGTYVLDGGILRFTVEREVGRRMGGAKEIDLLDPNGRKEMFGDSPAGEFEREFTLLPVTWSERVYLLYERDLKDFADAINLGLEPRSTLTAEPFSEPYYGAFYLRKGDERKQVRGSPSLPAKWLSYLLSKPVTATVVSIEETVKGKSGASYTATIDKGSSDGLRAGMRLLMDGEEPSPWLGTEVVSVAEKTARVRARQINSELKIGNRLSTRNDPKLDEYGALSWDEEKARLAKFAARLEQTPMAQGYVVAYAGKRARAGEALARANRARDYLEGELKLEQGRIVAVDGGYRERQAVELFAVRVGAKPPMPSPTVRPTEGQTIKRGVKSSSRRRRAASKSGPNNVTYPAANGNSSNRELGQFRS